MTSIGDPIEAVLKLNTSGFTTGVDKAIQHLENFNKASKDVRGLNDALTQLESSLQLVDGVSKSSLNTFSRLATAVNKMANGLKILQSDTVNVEQGINTMNSIFKAFQGTLNGTEVKVTGLTGDFTRLANSERSVASATRTSVEAQLQAVNSLNNNRNAVMSLITGENQLAVAEKQEAVASEQSSVAHDKASASMEKQTASTNRLGKAMSSLRMMGTMVASMMVYNFAHNLITATRETVNAKSEMEGYFQMLGFTTSQVGDFNKALDETVAKFPRLNKYALGETISSIGVEFELTTEEMKKAMPVVSMITSEYLRAGRNVNEASLAVKDILQGEFQRLSRETGVKGEQLMATGLWSGDKSDVMGLLKALDKVGKDRNWDIFVTKANSLNDAVLIMQNRFGEWSADMVNRFQPALLSVTNAFITFASLFASGLNGVLDWLSGDGIAQGIIKWGGLATALFNVTTGLISARTGAGLLQMAQMGLRGSIIATTLGLDAQVVATEGSTFAIAQRITGLEAEVIAETGAKTSILATVLGLEMETVAQYGLRTAILSNITGMEAQVVANKSLLSILKANKMAVIGLGLKLTALTTVIGVLVLAYGNLAMEIMQNTETMKNFHRLVNEGDKVVEEYNDKIEGLYQRTKDLKEIQSKYTQGSKEYINVGKAHKQVVDLINQSLEDRKDLEKAIDISKKAQERYTTDNEIARLKYEQQINQAIIDTGISTETARVLSNDYLREANDGAEQLSETTRRLYQDYRSSAGGIVEMASAMDELGYSSDEVADKVHELQTAKDFIIKGELQMGEAENLTEYLSGWATKQYGEITITVSNVRFKLEQDDIVGAFASAWKGVVYGIAGTLGKTPDEVRKIVEEQGGWGWTFINAVMPFDDLDYLFNVKLKEFLESLPDPLEEFATWLGSGDASTDLTDSVNSFFQPLQDTIMSYWNNFISFDWLFGETVSASDGSTDHPSFMEDLSNIIGVDIQSWVDSFISDPMGTLGIDLSGFDIIGTLKGFIFGNGDGSEDSEDVSWINSLFPPIDPSQILTYVQTNITQPFGTGIYNGIMQIPIVSDILQMLGFTEQAHSDASTKGNSLARAFGDAVETTVRNIPILGDILQFLGIIPQANGTAYQDGHGVGENIKKGESAGHQGMADNVRTEMGNVISAISSKFGEAYSTAHDIGSRILNGIKDALDMHSPSIISRELIANEFGVYIPQSISDAGGVAYATAQEYAMNIKQGIADAGTTTIGMDGMVQDYEADAQTIATSSQMMGTTTTTAFNDMSASVNATTGQMASDVGTQYTSIQQKQGTMLTNMKNQNLTAYNDMYLKSNQSLIQMRDSTSNVTTQMVGAWNHMKDNIIASANHLKSQSTSHFNQLSSTIGDFYGKIQNPARWGSGSVTPSNVSKRTPRNSSFGRSIAHAFTRHGAGGNPTGGKHTGSSVMTVGQAKRLLCPTGDCGNLFDGYSLTDKIDINDLFATMSGEHGFGWNDWDGRHFNYIRTTSNKWDMKSPRINLAGGIDTNTNFKVGEFENGRPNVSFSTFQSIAGDIFSRIPYKLYYDSSWKGSWLGALQAGACNCSDGADALIALASVFGFSGYKQWGKWGNTGHFWAVINGVPMDTTAWQGGYGWTSPKVSGYGSPNIRRASPSFNDESTANKTINVTVDMSNSTIYGVEDLDNRIEQGVRRGLREEFNDSYSVVI